MRHQQMMWKLVHNATIGQEQPMTVKFFQIQHTKQHNIGVSNKAENGTNIESSQNAENKEDAIQMNTTIQIFKHDMAEKWKENK